MNSLLHASKEPTLSNSIFFSLSCNYAYEVNLEAKSCLAAGNKMIQE